MNNIRLFNSLEEYNNSELQYPQVSFIEETKEVILEKYPPTIIARYVFDEDIPAWSYPFYQETTMSSKVTSFKVNGVETLEEKPLVVLGTYTPIATDISEELEGPIFTEESLITGAERVRIIFSKKPDIIGLYIEGLGNASQEINEWIDLFGLEVVSDTEYILNLLAVASDLEMDYSELTVTVWGSGYIDNPEGAVEEINSFNTILETISGGYTASGNQEGWQAGEYEVIIHLDRRYPTITELFKLNSFIREVRLLGNFNNFDTSFTFSGCSLLEIADLSKSNLKELGEDTFYNCSNLISINLPEDFESIGNYAFYNCDSLTSITLPESVISIGENAFYNCGGELTVNCNIPKRAFYSGNFTKVTVGESVTSIGNSAFNNCKSLTSITLPKSVISIGEYAFSDCTSLTSINIPESVTSIGRSAFTSCDSLTSITLSESVTSIGEYAFFSCTSLTSINIPESVISIGEYAFYSCWSLTSINIPESVTSIGEEAFSGCSSLTNIIVEEGNTIYDSRDNCNAIIETSSNCLIVGSSTTIIPESVTSIGYKAFYGCRNLTSLTIPESVTSIGNYAFYGCSSLTSINIPESVTSIGDAAFRGCRSLISITIPKNVITIENSAFRECSSLTSINIPESVTSIENYAFYNCGSLTTINLPESVKSIGGSAFYGCSSLISITSKAITPPSASAYVFNNVNKSIPVYVPASSIDSYKAAKYWKDFTNFQAIS